MDFTFERGDGDGSDIGVQLFSGILVIAELSGETNTDTGGDRLDALLPHFLVERGVETDILGSHGLLSKSTDGLHGIRSTLLEGSA